MENIEITEKAISILTKKLLQNIRKRSCKKEKNADLGKSYYIAIRALKKLKPMKVKIVYACLHWYECPLCGNDPLHWMINERDNYCPECGQRLDWNIDIKENLK